jgi:biotin/methionine sulfoxide reductase
MTERSPTKDTSFATHWGSYTARVRDGKLVEIRDFDADPDPSIIGHGLASSVYSPARIERPVVRKGFLEKRSQSDRTARGREPFVAVSWAEALDLAASELDRVRKKYGNGAIFGGSYGWASAGRFHHAQSQIHRFLNCIGGYTASIGTYSYGAVSSLTPHIVGHFDGVVLEHATSWSSIAEHTELMVLFGGMALKNTQANAGGAGRHTSREWMLKAAARGTRFISVSPLKSDTVAEIAAEWLPLRPNTDTALMLGIAHTLFTERLYDSAFLDKYTVGFERFVAYLSGSLDGTPKDAAWAAAISGVPAGRIRQLAVSMASRRTMISVSWSLQRADHGEQPCWMAIVLAAMLGQIGLPGGGFGIGYGGVSGMGMPRCTLRYPALPRVPNPVKEAIPVARIADALLNPNGAYEFNGRRQTYPDLRLVYWAGGNPFHHHQDINRLVEAFRQPETIIANEIWWNGLARHADIVFPTTTVLERDDIAMNSWDPLIVAMCKAIEPVGEARSDYGIFAGLASVLKVTDAFTEGRSEEDWLQYLWKTTRERALAIDVDLPSLEELRARGRVALPCNEREHILLQEFREDPHRHPLTTPTGKIEIFSETIDGFNYADCPGHPTWLEPTEWLGSETARKFPLHLLSNQPRARLHSQLDLGDASQSTKIRGREPILMNTTDARTRNLRAGDIVRVFNDRGACLAGLNVSDEIREGVVQLSTGAWYDPIEPDHPNSMCKHGSVNVLTRDRGTSRLGQCASANSALVEVERYDGDIPPLTAFVPPPILDTIL